MVSALLSCILQHSNGLTIANGEMDPLHEKVLPSGNHRFEGSTGLLADKKETAACFPIMGGGGNGATGGAGGTGTGSGVDVPDIEEARRRIMRMRMAATKRKQRNARKRINKFVQDIKHKDNN